MTVDDGLKEIKTHNSLIVNENDKMTLKNKNINRKNKTPKSGNYTVTKP
jgi:hypothetical protein